MKKKSQILISIFDQSIISPAPFMLIPPVIEIVDEVLDFTETMPEPFGGMESWNKYLSNNLKYPTPAKRMGVEGTVYISFIDNTDGSISNVELMRGIGAGCDEEAIKVITNAPAWKPGKQSSRPVRVKMSLPIKFRLQ